MIERSPIDPEENVVMGGGCSIMVKHSRGTAWLCANVPVFIVTYIFNNDHTFTCAKHLTDVIVVDEAALVSRIPHE